MRLAKLEFDTLVKFIVPSERSVIITGFVSYNTMAFMLSLSLRYASCFFLSVHAQALFLDYQVCLFPWQQYRCRHMHRSDSKPIWSISCRRTKASRRTSRCRRDACQRRWCSSGWSWARLFAEANVTLRSTSSFSHLFSLPYDFDAALCLSTQLFSFT